MFRLWLHILSWGYGVVVALRRVLYKKKIKKSVYYTHPKIIGIGNLSLGGTGKTPLVIYLAKLLSKHQSIALLSRGYKRKSTGFRVISGSESAVTVGDEPYLLYKNFIDNPNVVVAVCENRAQGVEKIMAYRPNVEVVLLDDAFQHLSLTPHVHILLTPFHQPFFKDHLLPLGRLREPRTGASRADIIVVTKSPPNLTASKMQAIQTAIQRYHTKKALIFFSYIIYRDPVRVTTGFFHNSSSAGNLLAGPVLKSSRTTSTLRFGAPCLLQIREPKLGYARSLTQKKHKLPTTLILVTGIADPLPLRLYLEKHGHKVKHLAFRDHHWFNSTDIIKISHLFHALDDSNKAILTTEKDYIRLIDKDLIKLLAPLPVYYMAIEVAFHQADKAIFEQKIRERLDF